MSILDCVLVGHYDVDFDTLYRKALPMGARSGFTRYLEHNSLDYGDKRLTYMQVLNQALRENGAGSSLLSVARLPNLASCYLRSFLASHGLSSEIVNYVNTDEALLRQLLEGNPRCVALSTTLYLDAQPLQELVRLIRKMNPDVTVVVGGPFVFNVCKGDTLSQNFVFDSIGADIFVNEPQGETTLVQLLQHMKRGDGDWSAIPNLIHRGAKRRWVRTNREQEDNDIDASSIRWSRFEPSFLGPTVQTRTARSCAYKCAFCSHPEMAGKLTLMNVDTVARELEEMQERGVQNVVFIDDTFNVPLPRFKSLLRKMIERKFDLRWFSYFRCSNSDDETFDLLARAGCAGVFLGIESGDQTVLENMNKFAKVDKLRAGVKKLNERGIVTFASFIVGFPGETDETVANTVRFIEDTEPTFYRAELWYADPHTPIMKQENAHEIRGGAFSWKHRTMDWQHALQSVDDMYRSIRCSRVLPVYDFDFWSIPYLLGKGMRLEQLKDFVSTAGVMSHAEKRDGTPDLTRLRQWATDVHLS